MRFALRMIGILAVSTSSHALAQTNATAAATPSPTQIQTGTPSTVPDTPPQAVELSAADGDGDIVVTAQRRTERLQSVPISVSVTTGPALQRLNILNLENLAVRTPAVRIAVAPISDFLAIRGVGSSLNQGFEQSVATFVDGIYRGRSRSTRAALFDVERVEVLKGLCRAVTKQAMGAPARC